MPLKDHYKTLELPALAGMAEIKRAYRRLVRKYHPDKSSNEQTIHFFHEVQEAYEVLSDPERRKLYDNELKHAGRYTAYSKDQVSNPEQVLKQAKDLHRYVQTVSYRSLNYDALTDFILGILSKENIALIVRSGNAGLKDKLVADLLESARGILAVRSFTEIAARLMQLQPDLPTAERITAALAERQQREKQNLMVPYASLAIVLLIILVMCLILFR